MLQSYSREQSYNRMNKLDIYLGTYMNKSNITTGYHHTILGF